MEGTLGGGVGSRNGHSKATVFSCVNLTSLSTNPLDKTIKAAKRCEGASSAAPPQMQALGTRAGGGTRRFSDTDGEGRGGGLSRAYGPEDEFKTGKTDEEEHLLDDGLSLDGQDAEFLFNDDEDPREHYSCQNSPLSNGTNQDAGYASPLSTTSDQLVDLKTTASSSSDQEKLEEKLGEGTESINGLSLQDSLTKMKAVYANLISDASWSSIALDMLKSKQGNNLAASNGSGSSYKGSNGFLSSHSSSNSHAKSRCSDTPVTTHLNSSSTIAKTVSSNSNTGISSASTGGLAYDWHQAALAKTLQQNPYQLLPEPSLFSTVQLYRQNNKLYGPVFTGASKFRCKDCSAAYDTLVGLTVHMNETGHYRDDNKDPEDDRSKRWSKPRKRSLLEMEGKEDAQKVLKCMYCGHSFESLQDLSVHMIKTKHYQKVPLKEPMPALTSKLVPPTKKRAFQELMSPSSPESVSSGIFLGDSPKDQKAANPYVTPNNRYGYQNGASYTWQFEARKAQILKCMECGSSHDTLQQLTAHMMVTGHFLKVTNSASKKGKQLVLDPVIEEKIQSIPLPPTTKRLPAPNGKPHSDSPLQPCSPEDRSEEKRDDETVEEKLEVREPEKKIKEEKEEPTDKPEKPVKTQSYQYLTEEDLEETPKEKSDMDGFTFEDSMEELSPIQRRKGRQSNWNPQHLLILQAQFASSLRETPEGKFIISDLGPQERVHICKFTGLSMTTISHWLANFRTPLSYINHLESHLGFTLKDLSKLSVDLLEQQTVSRIEDKTFTSSGLTEDDSGSAYQCKLCNRTFHHLNRAKDSEVLQLMSSSDWWLHENVASVWYKAVVSKGRYPACFSPPPGGSNDLHSISVSCSRLLTSHRLTQEKSLVSEDTGAIIHQAKAEVLEEWRSDKLPGLNVKCRIYFIRRWLEELLSCGWDSDSRTV
ncbi:hypothetical protein CCH79_00008740 [Gambusia affinis]|uniref:C2H2-type domain-containing protein n=1 Tax=Gambusia affinis TaxID=33528 RepID=A0A315UV67_GAMAF|nr:hypothetical protein CCH79_00008740 [Gambusia affinis]